MLFSQLHFPFKLYLFSNYSNSHQYGRCIFLPSEKTRPQSNSKILTDIFSFFFARNKQRASPRGEGGGRKHQEKIYVKFCRK